MARKSSTAKPTFFANPKAFREWLQKLIDEAARGRRL